MNSTLDLNKTFVNNHIAKSVLNQNGKLLMDVECELVALIEPYDDKRDLKVLGFNDKLFSLNFQYITRLNEEFHVNEGMLCIPRRELSMFPTASCVSNETSLHALLQFVAIEFYKKIYKSDGIDPRHRVKNLRLNIVESNDVITITFKE